MATINRNISNILIYNEILGIEGFPEQFPDLKIENKDIEFIDVYNFEMVAEIDKELDKYVTRGKQLQPDVVFIPAILGVPLSYYGVRLALHWRLDTKNKDFNKIPIVIMGFEEEAEFYKNCEYSLFFKTSNIYYRPINEKSIVEFVSNPKFVKDNFDIKEELEYYTVRPPESYKSHHAITNEWSILRWAEALKIKDIEIEDIRERFSNSLYNKYLLTKYPIDPVKTVPPLKAKDGKILIIDDEIDKGWGAIFKQIFGEKILLCGENFKDIDTRAKRIDKAINQIINDKPDVIILDLRLHDDDFEDNCMRTEISGYKILHKIKKDFHQIGDDFNPGIQVLVFSATNKVWNLMELQKAGADGFIMKESPELSTDNTFTNNNLTYLIESINLCLEFSFVKDLYKSYLKANIEIKQKIKSKIIPSYFGNEVLKWLEFSIENILRNKTEESLAISFLMLFSVIENISNRVIDVDSPKPTYEDRDGKPLYFFEFRSVERKIHFFKETAKDSGEYLSTSGTKFFQTIPWIQKILNTFDFLFDFKPDMSQINNLIQKRHSIIHPNATTGEPIKIDKSEIIYLFNLICNSCKNLS